MRQANDNELSGQIAGGAVDVPQLAPLLLTEIEAARMLSISACTLARLVKRGEICCVKIMGRLKRYRVVDLEAFVNSAGES